MKTKIQAIMKNTLISIVINIQKNYTMPLLWPIAAILNTATFCIHGGLTPRLDNINDINVSIKRPIHDFEHNLLLADIIWSDPDRSIHNLFIENPRERGFLFNHDAVAQFLFRNSVKKIIRAHQCVKKGTHTQFDEMCVTVFSASSYEKYMSNCSGIKIKIVTFPPLHRIEKKNVVYYKVQALCQSDDKVHHCFSFLHPKLYSNAASRMVMKQSRKLKSLRSENYIHRPVVNSILPSHLRPKIRANFSGIPFSLNESF